MSAPLTLLGQLSPVQFLADYWQKKPLLIRQAIPNFNGLLTPNELAGLACEEDVQARIVQNQGKQWTVQDGPFDEDDFTALPENDWSLLVQSINHHLPEAADLLSQFNFIPHARLDDLMVSYAPKGGSVGAHLDSYDVFLLQGSGKRRWQISPQSDLTLIEDAPLKILKHFEAEQEWLLAPGDMLYLPPNMAHLGISEDQDCMTYSIGFRAPKTQELVHGFLEHLQDSIQPAGLYEDADLSIQIHAAEISGDMVTKVEKMLQNIQWDKSNISDFLGRYLTEPKSDVIFEPTPKITIDGFAKQLAKKPISLALQSQMLFHQQQFFINGEPLAVPTRLVDQMQALADHRSLNATSLTLEQQAALASTLHTALIAGYVSF
ncbi:MAG: cupin [Methylophilaceae bacterium]|nr:MAG: cupin [Methylophilaceae bacterium]